MRVEQLDVLDDEDHGFKFRQTCTFHDLLDSNKRLPDQPLIKLGVCTSLVITVLIQVTDMLGAVLRQAASNAAASLLSDQSDRSDSLCLLACFLLAFWLHSYIISECLCWLLPDQIIPALGLLLSVHKDSSSRTFIN